MVLLGIIFLLIAVPIIATVDFVHLPFLLVGSPDAVTTEIPHYPEIT